MNFRVSQEFSSSRTGLANPNWYLGRNLIFSQNTGFSVRMITKTRRNTPKMWKNGWFSILVWPAEISFWAAGWPPYYPSHLNEPSSKLYKILSIIKLILLFRGGRFRSGTLTRLQCRRVWVRIPPKT